MCSILSGVMTWRTGVPQANEDRPEIEKGEEPYDTENQKLSAVGSKVVAVMNASVSFVDEKPLEISYSLAGIENAKSTANRVAARSLRRSSAVEQGKLQVFSPLAESGEIDLERARREALAFRRQGKQKSSLFSAMQSQLKQAFRHHLNGKIKVLKRGKLRSLRSYEARALSLTLEQGVYPDGLRKKHLARLYEAESSLAINILGHFEDYSPVVRLLRGLRVSPTKEVSDNLLRQLFSCAVFNSYWNENMLGWDMAEWLSEMDGADEEHRKMAVKMVVRSECWDDQLEACRQDLIAVRQVAARIADRHQDLQKKYGWTNEVGDFLGESRLEYLRLLES